MAYTLTYRLINNNTAYEVSGYTGEPVEVVIPSTYNGKTVMGIGGEAFSGCKSLTSVVIPDSIMSIGDYAFLVCDNLTSVYITDIAAWCNISFYSNNATPFSYAKNLYLNNQLVTELVIPDTVTEIKAFTFYGCSSLTSVVIPDSVTSIGTWAFDGCDILKSVVIGDGVESIGDWAFGHCHSLTEIVIPDSVISIGEDAFNYCESLKSVVIGDSVTSIGGEAFARCDNLTSVVIPDSVTIIGDGAFHWCESLTSVVIGNGVTSIGFYAFSGCESLSSATLLSKTPPTIYEYAFPSISSEAKFYCLSSAIDSYKAATNWKAYADKFVADDMRLYFIMNANAQKKYFASKEFVLEQNFETDINLENGTGDGSIQQVIYLDTNLNAKATGLGSVAFGGFRGDKPNEVPTADDRTNVAKGIQSAVFGCGNLAAGDWSFVSGKDNTVYSNRAFVSGGANMTFKFDSSTGMSYEKTNVGRFNAIFGNNNIFRSSNELNESNLIAGGSNLVEDAERSIIVGYNNTVKGQFNATFGQANRVNEAHNSIVSGKNNIVSGHANQVSGESNTVGGQYNLVSGQNNKNRGYHSATIGNTSYVGYNSDGTETEVIPTGSAAFGWSRANAHYSLSAGYDTEALESYSVALNQKTKTGRAAQTVVGKYNIGKANTLFEVGMGNSTSDRLNAFEVLENGGFNSYGNSKIEGILEANGNIKIKNGFKIYANQYDNLGSMGYQDISAIEFKESASGRGIDLVIGGTLLPNTVSGGSIGSSSSNWYSGYIGRVYSNIIETKTYIKSPKVTVTNAPVNDTDVVRLADLKEMNLDVIQYATEDEVRSLWA